MNPIIEDWFIELDEGEEELRSFIRNVSDAVIKEMKIPIGLARFLEDHGLAVVPTSRLWWNNPRSRMFSPVRSVPPGHVDDVEEVVEEIEPGADEVEQSVALPEVGNKNRDAFIQGVLEGVAVGTEVNFQTHPDGPRGESTASVGTVVGVTGAVVQVKSGTGWYDVDLNRGGRITLRR